jgi:hypothetical protein
VDRRHRTLCWFVLSAFVGACATTPPAPPPKPTPPPTASSSVGAVLEHAEELQLTQDQREKLESIDYNLTLKQNELREKASAAQAQAQNGEPTSKTDTPMADQRGGGSMGMGGMGKGGGRGMMGGGGGGRRSAAPQGPTPKAVNDKLDDNDTAAYLEGEQVLTEAQKPRARELASKYREQLFNFRASHPGY